MNRKRLTIFTFVALALFLAGMPCGYADTTPPASPVKLVFIHHSTGGNWLADTGNDPAGGLGKALMDNNYYVSATNYGWGPDAIGDTTDILDWPNWFTNPTVMDAVYTTTEQSFLEYGSWTRMATDPGGENKIVMFKSCFPNSEMYGSPDDAAASTIGDTLNVANAKAVYNRLLAYFETRQDKFFVVITNPPLREEEYNDDPDLTPAQRAANARAFTNWLVTDWLDAYPYNNVAVFNYFNVLTGANNHHRISATGVPENVTNDANNFAYYPSGDSHPNSAGQTKATQEFVPILNYYYNIWAGSCQGCCSSHGGVVCVDGVTQCGDGTALSSTCLEKGCVAEDCQGSATDTDGDGTPDATDLCPNDPNKIVPGDCGCGVVEGTCATDTDTDGDGTPDAQDECPTDPNKIAAGDCGCGVAEGTCATDTDGDGTPDASDLCPTDPNKIAPGDCGCGVAEGTCATDTDGDGTPDTSDPCWTDPTKVTPGVCGCGIPDTDTDSDGTPDCNDGCSNDPNKTAPGECGCGVAETDCGTVPDSDGDGVDDTQDGCPSDPNKTASGTCGCGVADTDTDGDGTPDCTDGCPNDSTKTAPGTCGCGVAEGTCDDTSGGSESEDDCFIKSVIK